MSYIVFANKNCTTALRGIAILIIIAGHVGVSGFNYRYFNPFGGIGVAMFLFLSGYGLTESYKTNKLSHFWTKKTVRILIPYLIWIPLYHIIIRISPLGSLYHIVIFPRYWFIEYLFIMYLVFYFTFRFGHKYWIPIMGIIGILIFFTTNNLRAEQSFSFMMGVLFSSYKHYFGRLPQKTLLSIATALFAIGIIALIIKQLPFIRIYDLESIQFKVINILLKLPIGLSIVCFTLSVRPNGVNLMSKIGLLSYELYLVHVSFFTTINNSYTNLAVFIIQSIILAYILHFISNVLTNKLSSHV